MACHRIAANKPTNQRTNKSHRHITSLAEVIKKIEICNEYNIEYKDYLDVACGTGNVTVRLAKYFKDVYAVDLSEDMLREAFNKFKENRIKGRIICQDMTEMQLNRKFDLITSVLDSTNYITDEDDLKKYFSSVKEHLKELKYFKR